MEINLYSDTQTVPCEAMYEAMISAPVGDEQHGRDPSVNALCEQLADMLGTEAALFLPTGTMCNVISFLVHCEKGDEVIAHETSHIITSEGGGLASIAGAMVRTVQGQHGQFSAETLQSAIRSPSRYKPRSRMVVLEQTVNFAGGTVWPLAQMQAVAERARDSHLIVHMDGARLFNASVASGVSAREYASTCDTLWVDLTKGLGCPVGAVLLGGEDFIEAARVWKQRLGGAMRQAGVLAGAGLYALHHNIDRLAEDHSNARLLKSLLDAHPKLGTDGYDCDTNIVFFRLQSDRISPTDFCERLLAKGVRLGAFSSTEIRAVTHLNVTMENIQTAASIILEVADEL